MSKYSIEEETKSSGKDNPKKTESTSYLAICIGLGLAFGVALHNVGMGLAIGVAIGAGMDNKNAKKPRE